MTGRARLGRRPSRPPQFRRVALRREGFARRCPLGEKQLFLRSRLRCRGRRLEPPTRDPLEWAAARRRVGAIADWASAVRTSDEATEPHRRVSRFAALGTSLREGLQLLGYPDFGLWLFRSPRLFVAVRCGPLGQNGRGGHSHNDQLTVEINIDGVDRVADPGTYLYAAFGAAGGT